MYILEFVLNADLDKQTVKCSNCGYTMIWRRREEFITKNDGGRQNLNKRRERQKYQSSFSK